MKNNLLIDHPKLVVGQKLWHIIYGEVTIAKISIGSVLYPIICNIPGRSVQHCFDINGKYSEHDIYPSLYLSNPFEEVNEFPKLMEVQFGHSASLDWRKRIILGYFNNKYLTGDKSENIQDFGSISKVNWWDKSRVREIQESQVIEYTLEEIAIKLGVDPNTIRIKK